MAEKHCKGISEDGGLFVPESFPHFDIMENLDLSYTDLAHKFFPFILLTLTR
ncbi:hypothetical protein [Peptoniphilus harei]|uniref:hypothetical protein n=1 Tax=Peptoniphilus harei TaxID=54005 RepID=UPI002E288826|nr:hypothetical protein [Peptoniphilus harei]